MCIRDSVLPGGGSIPAVDATLSKKAREAGQHIVDLARNDIKPSYLITKNVLLNAIMVDMAIAGSTNAVLHILSIANELELDVTMEDFDRLSNEIQCICGVMPSGPFTITDYYQNGATPLLMKALESKLHLKEPALVGGTWGEVLARVDGSSLNGSDGVIRGLDNPFYNKPGLKVLKGNLSEGGAIVRPVSYTHLLCDRRIKHDRNKNHDGITGADAHRFLGCDRKKLAARR